MSGEGHGERPSGQWWTRRRVVAVVAGALLVVVALAAFAGRAWLGQTSAPTGPLTLTALYHNSRDLFYRSPSGATPTGQPVVLRLRTAAGNAGHVKLRVWDTSALNGHGDVFWYDAARTSSRAGYDYWEVKLPGQKTPRTLWYKWLVTAGKNVAWYEDHYDRAHGNCDQVGGPGSVFTGLSEPDCSYRLNIYAPGFQVPEWVKHAVVYQIFVDRFYDGTTANDGIVQPNRYDGECASPDGTPAKAGYYLHANWNDEPIMPPQNCDFFGGDLQGVIAKLDYLHQLGVNTLYLNPIFLADSNHKYDTADYLMIDPHFGNLALWQELVRKAHGMGMHIILDGVFNHTSSDSIYFDRYNTWKTGGAYQTQSSRYADWYQFTTWPAYNGWFGVDSLPQLTEAQGVQNFLFAGDATFAQDANDAAIRQRYGEQPLTLSGGANSVATYWLAQGADAWRLDAPESKSDAWWEAFRTAIKRFDPDALLIGEHWGDASQYLLGTQDDGTMNYRFRSAVLGFFAKGGIDPDTGHDSGVGYTASQLDAHLQAVLEEYPLPAVYASMNLVDSHDVGRILWELGDKAGATSEQIALAEQKLRVIVQLQMTWLGAPTIYYGDEAGQTQTTYFNSKVDPGDRRTFPWDHQDAALENWYRQWIAVRQANGVLQTGTERTLLTDDAAQVFAFERVQGTDIAVVALNGDAPGKAHTVTIAMPGVKDGTQFTDAATHERLTVAGGKLTVSLEGMSGRVLLNHPA